jgi:hypothetical protein
LKSANIKIISSIFSFINFDLFQYTIQKSPCPTPFVVRAGGLRPCIYVLELL